MLLYVSLIKLIGSHAHNKGCERRREIRWKEEGQPMGGGREGGHGKKWEVIIIEILLRHV